MNKKELVDRMSEKVGFTKKDTKAMLEAFLETVEEALISGERVQLTGFGTFEARERAERQGHNPATGEPMVIPARIAPVFKAGKALKEAVNA